ncbi:MAG: T9SS type A sorting domain-containing protein [Bacteroidales bacterium]|nr:T9SS type A sorting domain-containing protein [Bacteroidales bacterium]
MWIEQKVSTQNTYYFRYADLDGENEQQAELEVNPYTSKNFVYYSLTNDEQIDREPPKDSWDLLFTRYISMINGETPYIVTGVLNNLNTPVAEYASVDPDFMDYQPADFDTAKSVIGYDWKEFDMGSFTYTVDDSLVYFVESHNGAVYKLRFTKFEGSSTGKVVFEKSLISTTGVEEFVTQESSFKAFPNPATDWLKIQSPYDGEVQYILHDITGRVAESGHFSGREFRLNVSGQERGVYLLQLRYDNHSVTNKIAIK